MRPRRSRHHRHGDDQKFRGPGAVQAPAGEPAVAGQRTVPGDTQYSLNKLQKQVCDELIVRVRKVPWGQVARVSPSLR